MVSLQASMQKTYNIDDLVKLVSAAQNSPEAFAALYDHYLPPVYRYLFSRVGNSSEAEELTSQTFLAALEALPRYREQGCFTAWLFRIARNKVMDHFRKDRCQLPLEVAEQKDDTNDPLLHVVQNEEIRHLAHILTTLDEDEKDLLRLRYAAELPFAEIALIVGKKEDTLKKNLYRLLARIQSQME